MLFSHPTTMDNIRMELDETCDDDPLSYGRLMACSRLRDAISETVRLYPPLILLMRRVEQTCTIGAWRVSADLGHEVKVDIATQFVQERNLTVTGWVTVDAVDVPAESRASHCDIEVRCDMCHVAPLEARASEIAPIRTLSYDIECTTSGGFPKADRASDCATFVAAVLHVYGKSAEEADRVLFSAGPCDPIDGADVRVYESEGEMLAAFRDYIIDCDADVITGYNIDGFDNRYVWTRASARAPTFPYLSRLIWSPSRLEERTQKSQQTGAQDLALLRMEGRITVDMHTVMRAKKETTYKLGAMARKYLKADKIHYRHGQHTR